MKPGFVLKGFFVFMLLSFGVSLFLCSGDLHAQLKPAKTVEQPKVLDQPKILQKEAPPVLKAGMTVTSVTPQKVNLFQDGGPVVVEVKGANLAAIDSVQVTRGGVEAAGIEETLDRSQLPGLLKITLKATPQAQIAVDCRLTVFDAGEKKLLEVPADVGIIIINGKPLPLEKGLTAPKSVGGTVPKAEPIGQTKATQPKPAIDIVPLPEKGLPAPKPVTGILGATERKEPTKPGSKAPVGIETKGPEDLADRVPTPKPVAGAVPGATEKTEPPKFGSKTPSRAESKGPEDVATVAGKVPAPQVSPKVQDFVKTVVEARSLDDITSAYGKAGFAESDVEQIRKSVESTPALREKYEELETQKMSERRSELKKLEHEHLDRVKLRDAEKLRTGQVDRLGRPLTDSSKAQQSQRVAASAQQAQLAAAPVGAVAATAGQANLPPEAKIGLSKESCKDPKTDPKINRVDSSYVNPIYPLLDPQLLDPNAQVLAPGADIEIAGECFGLEKGQLVLKLPGGEAYAPTPGSMEWSEWLVKAKLPSYISGVRPSMEAVIVLRTAGGKEASQNVQFEPALEDHYIKRSNGFNVNVFGRSRDWTANDWNLQNDWFAEEIDFSYQTHVRDSGHAEVTSWAGCCKPNGSIRTKIHAGADAGTLLDWTLVTHVKGPRGLLVEEQSPMQECKESGGVWLGDPVNKCSELVADAYNVAVGLSHPGMTVAEVAYFAYFEVIGRGAARYTLPESVVQLLSPHYGETLLREVQYGASKCTFSGRAMTDCMTIYFPFGKGDVAALKSDTFLQRNGDTGKFEKEYTLRTLMHELQHCRQCVNVYGRGNYGLMWFGQLGPSTLEALVKDPLGISASDIHDAMPMEEDARAKADKVLNTLYGL